MKDKHAAPGHTSIGALAAEGMLALPRQTKRLIMLAAPPVPIAMAFCATVVPKWSLMTAAAARVVGYRNSLRGSINGIGVYSFQALPKLVCDRKIERLL